MTGPAFIFPQILRGSLRRAQAGAAPPVFPFNERT